MSKQPDAVETILVRCPNWVGDVVMATPTLDCLKESFPTSRIIGVIRRNLRAIVQDGPWFDEVIDCEGKTWPGLRRMVKRIRAMKPDMAIILPNSIRSALPSAWEAPSVYTAISEISGV